eukprot:Pgem_evm2s15260
MLFTLSLIAFITPALSAPTFKQRATRSTTTSSSDGIPNTGYGCGACDGADVNYVIQAKVGQYIINNGNLMTTDWASSDNVIFRTRSFEDAGSTSVYCDIDGSGPYDGTAGTVGPCLQVKPGQTMAIKMINNMKNGMDQLDETNPVNITKWYEREPTFDPDFRVYGPNNTSTNIADFTVDEENMPSDFDRLNLHLHGMQVETHLFYPQGTSNETADWITIEPDDCFCYRFTVPTDHPQGTYYYHPHRHGAIAMQVWGGLFGPLVVTGAADNADDYLTNLTKDDTVPVVSKVMAIWDAHVEQSTNQTNTANITNVTTNYIEVAQFNDNQHDSNPVTSFMVNGDYQPEYSLYTNQTMRIRLVCGCTENMCGFRLRNTETNELVSLYNFGSDGSTWDAVYAHDYMILLAGQREEILIQVPQAGNYEFVQEGLEQAQWYETGPENQTLATLTVTDYTTTLVNSIDLSSIALPNTMVADLSEYKIVRQRHISFEMDAQQGLLPFEQYKIDNKAYNVSRIDQEVDEFSVEEWIITNSQPMVHPLHIHVNPFQVKEVVTQLDPSEEFTTYVSDTASP